MRNLFILMIFGTAVSAGAESKSAKSVAEVSEQYWRMMLQDPSERLQQGLPIDVLPDVSYQHAASEAGKAREMLARLRAVKPSEISHEEEITLDELRWELNLDVAFKKYFWLQPVITPYRSRIPDANRIFTTWQFKTMEDADRYIDLLTKYDGFIRSVRSVLATQLHRGIVLPKAEIALVDPFLAAYISSPDKSMFYVSRGRLASLPPAVAERIQAELIHIVETSVNPSLENLLNFVRGAYLANAPEAVGVSQYPGGGEYYRFLVRRYTTLEVTPEQVHRTGIEEVKRLNDRMAEMRTSLGFKGSKAEFHDALKKDPRFYARTPEEVQARLMAFVHQMEPKIDANFRIKPKAPYGVKRLDPALEGSQTFGHYEMPTTAEPIGYYYFNGSDLDHRSWANAEGLMYHELIPGHHFALNLQRENEKLPRFRRESSYTASAEGWGEYSSALGEELGLYKDPYDHYGRLAMEMFLAVRLVVDTGMNYFGWSRARAIEFMRDNVLESDGQIATETLRYSADMPGQALAYKMGALKIRELREKAKAALGARFDIRDFHDWFLASGSMPMTVLEKHIDYETKAVLSSGR
jgi:uncharacterized protein (DUF885 family)